MASWKPNRFLVRADCVSEPSLMPAYHPEQVIGSCIIGHAADRAVNCFDGFFVRNLSLRRR